MSDSKAGAEPHKPLLFALMIVSGLIFIGWLVASQFINMPEGLAPFSVGLLVGTLSSAAKIILIHHSLNKSFDAGADGARGTAIRYGILRYVMTIGILILPIALPKVVGLFGLILGVVALQFAAYLATQLPSFRAGAAQDTSKQSIESPADH